jgi:hypothetical protein
MSDEAENRALRENSKNEIRMTDQIRRSKDEERNKDSPDAGSEVIRRPGSKRQMV